MYVLLYYPPQEQQMHRENERLHNQIVEAGKVQKGSLYEKQCALEEIKKE